MIHVLSVILSNSDIASWIAFSRLAFIFRPLKKCNQIKSKSVINLVYHSLSQLFSLLMVGLQAVRKTLQMVRIYLRCLATAKPANQNPGAISLEPNQFSWPRRERSIRSPDKFTNVELLIGGSRGLQSIIRFI